MDGRCPRGWTPSFIQLHLFGGGSDNTLKYGKYFKAVDWLLRLNAYARS